MSVLPVSVVATLAVGRTPVTSAVRLIGLVVSVRVCNKPPGVIVTNTLVVVFVPSVVTVGLTSVAVVNVLPVSVVATLAVGRMPVTSAVKLQPFTAGSRVNGWPDENIRTWPPDDQAPSDVKVGA